MVIVLVPPIKMGLVLKAHVLPEEQARVMAPVKLVDPVASMRKVVWVLPISTGFTVTDELGVMREKAASPIPERATVWGLPVAVSAMLKIPLRVPLAMGEKVTLMLQLCPTARVLSRAAQVLVCVNSVLLVEIWVMFNVAVPVLVMVTLWGGLTVPTFWLVKERLVGATVTAVAAVTPDPLRAMVCWVPAVPPALSVMVI